jgi:formylglycine-generating enzyme
MTTTIAAPTGMAWIPPGRFTMGCERFYAEEAPVREVTLERGFFMDKQPVTVAAFRRFVDATGYVTVAERPLDGADYPDADPAALVPGSLVFHRTAGPVDLRRPGHWWRYVPGVSWRSAARGRHRHPVTHVACEDAEAYAAWAGKALPTEAEWERAARGGLDGAAYTWGDEPEAPGERRANYWHGDFPWRAAPGYGTTSPVGAFPANGHGLHDMAGNVWEWTADWYAARHPEPAASPCCVPRDPRGGDRESSLDPAQPQFAIPRKVIKGGSFLCADSYCRRYRPAARRPQAIDTGMSHIGFRCVSDVDR